MTPILIGTFVGILAASAHDDQPHRHPTGAEISLGRTVHYVEETSGEVGLTHRGWSIHAGKHGNVELSEDATRWYTVSRMYRPDWYGVYTRIGVGQVQGSRFVGDTNFRLGLGYEYGLMAVEWVHLSSANIHRPNTGIDIIQIRLHLEF